MDQINYFIYLRASLSIILVKIVHIFEITTQQYIFYTIFRIIFHVKYYNNGRIDFCKGKIFQTWKSGPQTNSNTIVLALGLYYTNDDLQWPQISHDDLEFSTPKNQYTLVCEQLKLLS